MTRSRWCYTINSETLSSGCYLETVGHFFWQLPEYPLFKFSRAEPCASEDTSYIWVTCPGSVGRYLTRDTEHLTQECMPSAGKTGELLCPSGLEITWLFLTWWQDFIELNQSNNQISNYSSSDYNFTLVFGFPVNTAPSTDIRHVRNQTSFIPERVCLSAQGISESETFPPFVANCYNGHSPEENKIKDVWKSVGFVHENNR